MKANFVLLAGVKSICQRLVKGVVQVWVILPRSRGGGAVRVCLRSGMGEVVSRAEVVEVIDLGGVGIMVTHREGVVQDKLR